MLDQITEAHTHASQDTNAQARTDKNVRDTPRQMHTHKPHANTQNTSHKTHKTHKARHTLTGTGKRRHVHVWQ